MEDANAPAPLPTPDAGESPKAVLPLLPHGFKVPRRVRPADKRQGLELMLSEIHAVAMWWGVEKTIKGTARMCGLHVDAVRVLVNKGVPRRGIPPLRDVALEDLPPLPPAWRQKSGSVPAVEVDAHGQVVDEEPPAPTPPVAVLVEVPNSPGISQIVRSRPVEAPPVPAAPLAAVALAPAPQTRPDGPSPSPGGAIPSPSPPKAPTPAALPSLADPPTPPALAPRPGVEVEHTLAVSQAEVVRLARNARAVYALKIRGLIKLHGTMAGDLRAKDAPRLTKSQRDMLMLLREIRVDSQDVERLYKLERDILGVGGGGGIVPPIPGEESPTPSASSDAATLDDLAAQVRELLAPNANTAALPEGSLAASPEGGMPVHINHSLLDRPGFGTDTPPSGVSGNQGGPDGR